VSEAVESDRMLLPTITARITRSSLWPRGVRNAQDSYMQHLFVSVHGDSQLYTAMHAFTRSSGSSIVSQCHPNLVQLLHSQAIVQHVHLKSRDIYAIPGLFDDLRQGLAIHQNLFIQTCNRLCDLFCSPHQHIASDGGPYNKDPVLTIHTPAQQFA